MRISVSSWATTDADVERSVAAMVRAARASTREVVAVYGVVSRGDAENATFAALGMTGREVLQFSASPRLRVRFEQPSSP